MKNVITATMTVTFSQAVAIVKDTLIFVICE